MKLKTTTFAAILCFAILPFLGGGCTEEIQKQDPVEQHQSCTNNIGERATQNQNLDWFKQGSTYIWDGWKIK